MKSNHLIIGSFILLVLFVAGCAGSAYKDAMKQDTHEAYSQFLIKYPDSEYSAEARKKIIQIDFEKTKKMNTGAAYKEFLKNHPQSEFSVEAEKLVAKFDWEDSLRLNTAESYKEFLRKHPQNDYSQDAKVKIEKLDWEEALRLNTIGIYQEFLRNHDQSAFCDKAESKMYALLEKQAKELKEKRCSDETLMKTFPEWLRKQEPGEEQMGNRMTMGGKEVSFDGYLFISDESITVEMRRGYLIYLGGKGVIIGRDGTKTLVGYDCN